MTATCASKITRRCLAEFAPKEYLNFIAEHVEPWSYMKFPYFKPQGYPEGAYRVGPLGRLNAARRWHPAGRANWKYRQVARGNIKGASLLYHYARLIELLYALEKAQALLMDERICGRHVRDTSRRPMRKASASSKRRAAR